MSSENVQKIVLAELRDSGVPMTVSQIIEQVRRTHSEFNNVPDFDIRAAILAMLSIGAVESTRMNQISARVA